MKDLDLLKSQAEQLQDFIDQFDDDDLNYDKIRFGVR